MPGFVHDICSSIHPLGVVSPALRDLPPAERGLSWVHPDVPLAHALDDGRATLLHRSIADTAAGYGLMLGALGHRVGWPMDLGGSQAIADALVSLLQARGAGLNVGGE